MSGLRQGFSWWCFANRGVEAEELLLAAARIGYEAVDLVPETLWPLVRQCGLRLGAVAGHESIEQGLNDPASADRIEKELLASIDKAGAEGIPTLICFSGNRNGLDDETGLTHCAKLLARLAPRAEQAGVVLAMELLNSKINHPDYQCDTTAWGLRLCERVGSPAVRLLYDIYHMQVMEGDLIRTIREHHEFFAHYHTAGNPGRGQPDETQEIYYPAIYRVLAEQAPGILVSHEFIPSRPPIVALKMAFESCAEAVG